MEESRQAALKGENDPEILTKKPKDKRDRSREDSIGGLSNSKSGESRF
jgi:hypothetical protein